MMIIDAIKSASSEHAVYFLLTAYIESLRHFEHAPPLPEPVLRLPLIGAQDLRIRLAAVSDTIDVPWDIAAPAPELADILGAAVTRLSGLDACRAAAAPALRAA